MTDLLRLIDHPLIATLGWTLTHFVWQGAILGLMAFVLLRVVQPRQASVRYLIGVATLATMLVVPVLTFLAASGRTASTQAGRQPASTARIDAAGAVTGAMTANFEQNPRAVREWLSPRGVDKAPADPAAVAPRWLPLVTAGWFVGVAVLSLRLIGGWALAIMLGRRAVRAVSHELEAAAHEIARRLGLRRGFRIVESSAVSVPTLVGWVKPVVLLPATALSGLSPAQLEAIVAHELAHIRRHDYLVNLLQSVVETLLFYHPAVWWVSAEVRAEREHCCDDLAVDVCGDRLVYVSALAELTTIERRAFALAATDGSLVSRVRRILGRPAGMRRELPPSWGVLALLVIVASGAGTYEMSADATAVEQVARAAAQPSEGSSDSGSAMGQPAAAAVDAADQWPPAPPAPPEPGQGSQNSFVWNNDTERLSVRWTGSLRLTDDERDVASLDEGATLTISDGWVFTDRIEMRGLPGGRIERKFYRSGVEREFNGEARAFLERALQRMVRSGAFASDRVARLLKRGGPDAVFDELERGGPYSSHVTRVYLSALLKQADLTTPQLTRVLDRIGKGVSSDHDKATLLQEMLRERALSAEQRTMALRAARTISSDFEQRRVVLAALPESGVTRDTVLAALDVAETITSSHDRRQVLEAIAARGGVTPQTSERFMAAVTSMSSSHDQRQVLTALAATSPLSETVALDAVKAAGAIGSSHDRRRALVPYVTRADASPKLAAAALASTTTITSSHDKAQVLLQVVKQGITDQTAPAFFTAVGTLSSSHDMSRVLNALVASGRLSENVLAQLLQAARKVSSSTDRASLLLAVLKSQPLTGANRSLFVEVAEGISSTHDQNQVLAALVRAERR